MKRENNSSELPRMIAYSMCEGFCKSQTERHRALPIGSVDDFANGSGQRDADFTQDYGTSVDMPLSNTCAARARGQCYCKAWFKPE
jgi:hypothetical protein